VPHRRRLAEHFHVGYGLGAATDAVLKNLVVFGTVHAGRRHYYRAANVPARADRSWLEQLLTGRVGPDDLDLARGPGHIQVVMEFQSP
jgi:hypothetical protein